MNATRDPDVLSQQLSDALSQLEAAMDDARHTATHLLDTMAPTEDQPDE